MLIYGFSLGSAVAVDLATRVPAAGLMLEGALLSVPIRGAELYPFLPVDWMARNRFASVDKIARVSMPKLFIHARADADIPVPTAAGCSSWPAPQALPGGRAAATPPPTRSIPPSSRRWPAS